MRAARTTRRRDAALVYGVWLAACCADAKAAEPRLHFEIPSKPLRQALIDLASAAHVSINLQGLASCADRRTALVGAFSVAEGLTRLLRGTGCSFRKRDEGAYELIAAGRQTNLPRAPAGEAPKPASPEATSSASELVVVATRRATPADRLAYAVSTVDRPTLGSQGLRDLGDLASSTPGMTVTNLGMGRDKILLRGLSDGPLTGQTESMVGLYLDDTRLTYNAPDPDLKLVDIASVEVLRGPQGALYGTGALGGVVHLVSVPPDPSRVSAWASAGFGTTEGGAASQDLDAAVNLPLLAGRGAVRVVLFRELDGGFINDTRLGLKDVNKTVREGDRISVAFQLSPSWSVSAGLVEQAINSADTQYATAGAPAYSRANTIQEPHDNDFSDYHASLQGDPGWGRVHGSVALINHNLDSVFDASAAPPVPVPSSPAAFAEANIIQSEVVEVTLASPTASQVQWLAGAFYAHTRQSFETRLTAIGAGSVLALNTARRDVLDEAAIYGEAVARLGPAVSLTLGGRVFGSYDSVRSIAQTPLTQAAVRFSGATGEPGFAPKLVLSLSPSSRWLAYLQATEGYRAEGVNTAGAPGQTLNGADGLQPHRDYQRDELWNLEAGGKLRLLDDRVMLRLAAFEEIWKSIQSNQLLPSGLPFVANLGDGRNIGLEAETVYRWAGLELRGNVLINGPELYRASGSLSVRADSALSAVPNVSAGAAFQYVWALRNGAALQFDGRWAYVGASQLTLNAATPRSMGDYTTARLSAALNVGRFQWSVAVDNLFDSRGNTFAFGNPFSFPSTPQFTPLRPRTVSLAIRAAY